MSDITVTPSGVIFHAASGDITVNIPNFNSLGIDPTDLSTYHFYDESHVVGSSDYKSTNFIENRNIIWNNLQEEPFPTFGFFATDVPVSNGSVSNVPILGDVTHYVDYENNIVVNVTTESHMLNPGVVIRHFYEDNGSYVIDSVGFGNGFNPLNANQALADFVWGNNAERIQRESIFEDNSPFASQFDPVEKLELYKNQDFSQSFSSLGYSDTTVEAFDLSGWSGLSPNLGEFDDFAYDVSGTSYTIFSENSLLTLPSIPTYEASGGFWDSVQAGDYVVNNDLSEWNGTLLTYQNFISPLSFDLDGDGIETTHLYATNVFFDIDGDGYAEKVGWIGPDDGQLALDRDGNGTIDDITELFGDDIMPAYDKLALLDTNGNGLIDAGDDEYSNLLVWRDINQDGYSDANELFALTDASIQIKEISLAETPQDTTQNENFISGSSSFTRYDNTTGTMYDVHFLNDNVNTWFQGARSEEFGSTYQVSPEALLLPLSRGYGSLASLHLAMTDNPDLRAMMRELVTLGASDTSQIAEKMTAFLYEWAGVTENDPEARKTGNGSNIDARKVDFLEAFTGVEWQQMGVTSLVGSKASVGVKKIWAEIANLMTVRVLVQGTLKQDIFQNASYDFKTDTLTLGDTMTDLIARAQTYIAGEASETAHEFWLSMGNILIMHAPELGETLSSISTALDAAAGEALFIGEQTLTSADGDIYSAIDGLDETLTTNVLVGDSNDNTITGSEANDYIFGGGGADTLNALGGDDFLRGDDQDDVMDGGAGDDRLEGSGGNDTLTGGTGRDDLRGGEGTDTLIGGDGQDKLHGGAGADIIDGGAGDDEVDYLESDTGVYVDLKLNTSDGGHAAGDMFENIENITGSDFSDVLIGDDGANGINGEKGDDLIRGGKGDDELFGADGNDQLFGEEGNDTFDGFAGAELMDGGTGVDTVNYIHPFNTTGVHADLEAGQGYVGAAAGDTYVSIENLVGSEHDDILVGDANDNILEGRGGTDMMFGGGGNDILLGGAGSNQLSGGSGADRFIITPHEAGLVRIHDFNPAEDILDYSLFTTDVTTATEIAVAAIGNDTILGIDDTHFVLLKNILPGQLSFSNFQVHATDTTLATVTTYTNVDTGIAQQGDSFGNKLTGTFLADTIDGQDGGDEIFGLEGDDTLNGNAGNDTLMGGGGADDLDGGAGVDLADYRDSHEGVTIDLAAGTGVGGAAEGDTLANIEAVEGSAFDDVITGNSENNILSGNVGNDVLYAGGGQNNLLQGGYGNDTFVLSQVSGAALPDTGLVVWKDNGDGTFTAQGSTPTSIALITDFEAGNADEKLNVSGFTLTEMYVRRIEGATIEGEPFDGVGVYLFNGTESQMVLLQDADYDALSADSFVLPAGFSFDDIHWQVIGDTGDNVLLGSLNDDTIFASGGGDIIVGGEGDDTVFSNYGSADGFIVSKNADDVETIYNFDSYYRAVQWLPGFPIGYTTFTVGGEDADYQVEGLSGFFVNGLFNLSAFADIRTFGDLTISTSGSDTVIDLGDNQDIILKNYVQGLYWGPNNTPPTNGLSDFGPWDGTFNDPVNGIVGTGRLYDTLSREVTEDNFVFYDGTLEGDEIIGSVNDILEGGYGVDNIFGYTGDDVLTGEGDDDVLNGGSGNDVLDGGLGNDTLTGGDDADVYIIGKEAGATDTITHFEYWRPEEQIDLSAFDADFADFDALKQNISQQGNDTHIDLGAGQALVLKNFDADNLINSNVLGNAGFNTLPVAQADTFDGIESLAISGDLLADNGIGVDSDPDGYVLSVVAKRDDTAQGGSVVIAADGTFTYTPAEGFYGTDSFFYTLQDGLGGSVTASVTLNLVKGFERPVWWADMARVYGFSDDPAIGMNSEVQIDTALAFGAASFDLQPSAVFAPAFVLPYVSLGSTLADQQAALDDLETVMTFNRIEGTDSAEVLSDQNGVEQDSVILAGDGDDDVFGYEGHDVGIMGAGTDRFYGGDGNDVVIAGVDDSYIYGGNGRDTLIVDTRYLAEGGYTRFNDFTPGPDGDVLDLGPLLSAVGYTGENALQDAIGDGTIRVVEDSNGTRFKYDADGFGGVSPLNILKLYHDTGTWSSDDVVAVNVIATTLPLSILRGDTTRYLLPDTADGHDLVLGTAGQDYIISGGGDDVLIGNEGADILRGGAGVDLLIGHDETQTGGAQDTVSYAAAVYGLDIRLQSGRTLVEDDGQGAYDILSNIDHLIATDHDDVLRAQQTANIDNRLFGMNGDDVLYGYDGDDVLVGGAGIDILKGGDDNDFILGGMGTDYIYGEGGQDTIKIEASALFDTTIDSLKDFTLGAGGDFLDISEIVIHAGYTGATALADAMNDGVIRVDSVSQGTKIRYDADGFGGESSRTLVTVEHTQDPALTQNLIDNNIISVPLKTILFVPVLGQSNAAALTFNGSDSESGMTHLIAGLEEQTAYDEIHSVMQDNEGRLVHLSEGASTVDGVGNGNFDDRKIWWHPDTQMPGEMLLRTVDLLQEQLTTLRMQGAVKPVIVWGQGESEASVIGAADHVEAAGAAYKANTLAIFDYIRAHLGNDFTFYIMQTGQFVEDAFENLRNDLGYDPVSTAQRIAEMEAGLVVLQQAQEEMAQERDDIKLGVNYEDLKTRYENYLENNWEYGVDPVKFRTDYWHLDYEAYEVVGDRLAGYIALDQGQTHIVTDPGPYPADLLEDLDLIAHAGKTVTGTSADELVAGTQGDDTLRGKEGFDMLYGGAGNDDVRGGEDDDILVGGDGDDTLVGGTTTTDTFSSHDILDGGNGNDVLRGERGDDVLRGGAGDDHLWGGEGADLLDGGSGNDNQRGGLGDDTYLVSTGLDYVFDAGGDETLLYGEGATLDTLHFAVDPSDGNDLLIDLINSSSQIHIENQLSSTSGVEIETISFADGSWANLAGYDDWLFGSATGETLTGSNSLDDTILGYGGDDSLYGKDGNDGLFGGAGNDYLRADDGNDLLVGGAGDDDLRGDAGDDVLMAGSGADRLQGDAGADTFFLYGTGAVDGNLNRVVDFSDAEGDSITLSDVLIGYDPLQDSINDFITLAETSHTYVKIDRDGTGGAYTSEQAIRIEYVTGQWTDAEDMINQGHLSV